MAAMLKEAEEEEVEEAQSTDLSTEQGLAGDRSEEDRLTIGERDLKRRQQLSVSNIGD